MLGHIWYGMHTSFNFLQCNYPNNPNNTYFSIVVVWVSKIKAVFNIIFCITAQPSMYVYTGIQNTLIQLTHTGSTPCKFIFAIKLYVALDQHVLAY